MSDSSPGWQPDPTGKHDHRYWDGSQWTENISDAGVAGTDPYEPAMGEVADAGDPTVASEPVDPTRVEPGAPGDATTAWPTTPGAPAPPPPYVPTDPASPGDGGSKKGLLIGGGILAAVVVAVLVFLALNKDDDKVDKTAAIDSTTTTAGEDSTTTTEASRSDGEGTYGSDPELDALYDDCKDGDYQACDDLFFKSPSDSEYEAFGDTCGERNEPSGLCVSLYGDDSGADGFTDSANLPEDFEGLADFYEQALGLSSRQAQCLADKLEGVFKDGDLTEDQAFTEVFGYLSDCDISLEDISGGGN